MTLSPSDHLRKLDKAIRRIDRNIEFLHKEFDVRDREIEPAVHLLSKARMTLENLKISLERSENEVGMKS